MSGALQRRWEHTGGESYFISLNDLLVGMLFVFIILLMAFALSYQSAENAMKAELTQRTGDRTKLLNSIKLALDAEHIKIPDPDLKNGVLHLPENALFDTGSADLGPTGQRTLTVLANILDQLLPCYSAVTIKPKTGCPAGAEPILEAVYVEGHTDNVPIRTSRYASNWELSSDRAIHTFNYMLERDPDLAGVRNGAGIALFGVSAYADKRPVTPDANLTADGRAKNRRIDLRFLLAPWDKPSAATKPLIGLK